MVTVPNFVFGYQEHLLHFQKSISRTRRRERDLENNNEQERQNFTGKCMH